MENSPGKKGNKPVAANARGPRPMERRIFNEALAGIRGHNLSNAVLATRALQRFSPGPHPIVHDACKMLDAEGRPIHLKTGETPGADRLAHYFALAHG